MRHITRFARKQLSTLAGLLAILALAGVPEFGAAAPKETALPQILPGTFKITVRARGTDGAKPVGSQCQIQSEQPQQTVASRNLKQPVVTGADGDWIIYNVTPDNWYITIQADDFAWSSEANSKRLTLRKVEDVSLEFTLLRGSTVKGRVVDGVTGKPIQGAVVAGGDWDRSRDETDAEGQFTLKHVNPGQAVNVRVKKKDYVPMASPAVAVEEGQTAKVGDTKMYKGGWIRGRIVARADALSDVSVNGSVMPTFENKATQWPGSMPESASTKGRLHDFRLGPLQPGLYTLDGWLGTGKPSPGHPHRSWHGTLEHVQVTAGKETSDIVIPVEEQKRIDGPGR